MKASLPYSYKVYKKKNKLYVVVTYKESNGNAIRKWIPTGLDVNTKKKEVAEVAEKLVADFIKSLGNIPAYVDSVDAKEPPSALEVNNNCTAEKTDLIEFMDKWLEYKKPRIARTSYMNYISGVNSLKAFFEGKKLTVQSLKPIDVQEYYSSLIKSGMKITSVKNRHLTFHNIMDYAVKLDMIAYNPTSRVELPKSEKHEATFYSKQELEELFKVFEGDRMELVVHIAAYYGLRRSEIIGLKWDCVNFSEKTITIRRKIIEVTNENGKNTLVCENKLKTNATKRTLPLVPHIEKMLCAQKELQSHYRKLFRGGYNKEYNGFVCTDNYGELIAPSYVTAHFRHTVRKNKLRYLRFHDLRHTCASLLIANHIPLKAVQDWLGHENFETTANIYSHLDYTSRIESAETITNVLGDMVSGIDGNIDKEIPPKKGRKPKSTNPENSANSDSSATESAALT